MKKVRFLDILVIVRLDLGRITFNLVENAFATQQLALSCHQHRVLAYCDSGLRRPTSLGFSAIFGFLDFFAFPLSPFLFFLPQ